MIKKTPSQCFRVPIDIYNFHIFFSISQTDKEFDEFLKKNLYARTYNKIKKTSESEDILKLTSTGYCYLHHQTQVVLIRLKGGDVHNTLSHEIRHAVDFILRNRLQIPCIRETDEVYAYLTGWIHGEAYKNLKYGEDK